MFETNQVEQIAYTNDSLIVGLPLITDTYEKALDILERLPYRTYGIGAYKQSAMVQPAAIMPRQSIPGACFTGGCEAIPRIGTPVAINHKPLPFIPAPLPTIRTAHPPARVMKVKADINADIYHLYALDDTLIGTATIPSYKCSVMMNALFRHIKENANLDLLEESDDEEEFENNQNDKFVDLDKTILMECVYQKKFQRWQPMKVVK
jgi:hypothetical protein